MAHDHTDFKKIKDVTEFVSQQFELHRVRFLAPDFVEKDNLALVEDYLRIWRNQAVVSQARHLLDQGIQKDFDFAVTGEDAVCRIRWQSELKAIATSSYSFRWGGESPGQGLGFCGECDCQGFQLLGQCPHWVAHFYELLNILKGRQASPDREALEKYFRVSGSEFVESQDPGFQLKGIVFFAPEERYLSGVSVRSCLPNQNPDLRARLISFVPKPKSLADRFGYLFADGSIHPWQAVHRGPWSLHVSNALQPVKRGKSRQRENIEQFFSWWKNYFDYYQTDNEEYAATVGLCSLFLESHVFVKEKIPFYFGFSDTQERSTHLYEIQATHFLDQGSRASTEGHLRLVCSESRGLPQLEYQCPLSQGDPGDTYAFPFGYWIVSRRELIFQDCTKIAQLLSEQPRSGGGDQETSPSLKSKALIFESGAAFNNWSLRYFHKLSELVGVDIAKEFDKGPPRKIRKVLNYQLGSEMICPSLQLEYSIAESHFVLSEARFSEVARDIAQGAWASWLKVTGAELASGQRRHRSYDLRFMRHHGSFATMILEILYFHKFHRTFSEMLPQPRDVMDLIHELAVRLGGMLFSKDSLDASLEQILSVRVWGTVTQKLQRLYQELDHQVDRVVFIQGQFSRFEYDANETDLLLADLLALVYGKGTSPYQKMTDAIFLELPSVLMAQSSGELSGRVIDEKIETLPHFKLGVVANWKGAWLERLRELEYEIYFNGEPLAQMADGDLRFSLEFMSQSAQKWFDLDPAVYFRGKEIRASQFQTHPMGYVLIYEGKPYLIDRAALPQYNQILRVWERLFQPAGQKLKRDREVYQLPMSARIEILSLVLNGVEFKGDEEFIRISDYFLKMQGRKSLDPGLEQEKILLPYQKTGVQWLKDMFHLNLGGILADEMGLGKTAQTIRFFANLWAEGRLPAEPQLVVVPTTLIFNWKQEFQKFAPDFEVEILTGETALANLRQTALKRVWVVSYGMLAEHAKKFEGVHWGIVVFDEAHQLKNSRTIRYQAAFEMQARYKMALTGTPLENNLNELRNILSLILQGELPQWKPNTDFELRYIQGLIHPFVQRRTKASVHLELPEKIDETVVLSTSDEFKEGYKIKAAALNNQVLDIIDKQGAAQAHIHILAALTKMRQFCSEPSSVEKSVKESPKREFLIERVEESVANNESCLIFSQFLATIEVLEKELTVRGVPYLRLDGSTPQKRRVEIIHEFQSSQGAMALLMTLKTGGVGLNLTRANVVFHVDPWWNPAVEHQATDRVHRMGQTKTVQSFRLILKDTLEEKIQLMKIEKQRLFESVFAEGEMGAPASIPGSMAEPNFEKGLLRRQDFEFLMKT